MRRSIATLVVALAMTAALSGSALAAEYDPPGATSPSTGTTVLSDQAYTQTTAAGSATSVCPPGSVLTGAHVTASHSPNTTFVDYPYVIVARCAALQTTVADGQLVTSATGPVTDGSELRSCADSVCGQYQFNGAGPQQSDANCPDDQAVTSLQIVSGYWLDELRFGCQALDATGVPTGTVTDTDYAGGNHNPSGPRTPVSCPAGDVAVGLQAETDQWIHLPQLECAPVIPGSPTYGFTGFTAPLITDGFNVMKAGRAIPVKWSLTGLAGDPVVGAHASLTSIRVDCATGTGDTVNPVDEYATGASGLQDFGDGTYQWNWATSASYAGTCRELRLTLDDTTVHRVLFSFR